MSTATATGARSWLRHRRPGVVGLTFAGALAFSLVARPGAAIAIALLFLVFGPLERRFPFRPQRVFRAGLVTDLTHLLANTTIAAVATIALVVVGGLPLVPVRALDIEGSLPSAAAVPLAVVLVALGSYWGHRLTHVVPLLWRFHSVHHSIEQMDWVASGRLHPFDSAFAQAFAVMPLFVLGYDGGVFAGVGVGVTLLALFQHANVGLRFPGLRWVVNTPEWHHWHHAIDPCARDKNFGLPVVDRIFGTAYLPEDRRPSGFGTLAPVPREGYLRHLAHPFTAAAAADG